MALDSTDRQRVTTGLMRYWSRRFETVTDISKTELLAAVAATDDWIEDNQVQFNAALPQPVRANAALAQKTLLFCAVALARVSLAFTRTVFGEVD